MKTSILFPRLTILLMGLILNSCTKESGLKKIEKLSAADCPRVASLSVVKKEALYTVSTFAGEDNIYNYILVDGTICKARFGAPTGIAISKDGTIYISDNSFHDIRKISNKGIVSTIAGDNGGGTYCQGDDDGTGQEAQLCVPSKLVIDKDGNLIFIDQGGSPYRALRKAFPSGLVSTIIGRYRDEGYKDGPLLKARFNYFATVAIGSDGSIFLYEGNNLVRRLSLTGTTVSTFAGQKPENGVIQKGYRDGPKDNALFGWIRDMAFGPDGSLYLCDFYINKKIRRVTKTGMVETFADVDASSITISDKGIVYVANGYKIFRIDADGMVTTVAGGDTSGYKNGVGSEARFRGIRNMAIYNNYLYITDGSTIRRMTIE